MMNRKDTILLDYVGSAGAILLSVAGMYYFGQMVEGAARICLYVLGLVISLVSLPGVASIRFLVSEQEEVGSSSRSSQNDTAGEEDEAMAEASSVVAVALLSEIASRLAELGHQEEALVTARRIESEVAQAAALVRAAPYLSESQLPPLPSANQWQKALAEAAREIASESVRAFVLMQLVPHLSSVERERAIEEVTELAQVLAERIQAQDAAETDASSALGEFVKDYDGRIKFPGQPRIIGAESDEMEPTTDVSVSSSTEG